MTTGEQADLPRGPIPLPVDKAAGRAEQVRGRLAAAGVLNWEGREVTCQHCDLNAECDFAFDLYNTDGDCLAEK